MNPPLHEFEKLFHKAWIEVRSEEEKCVFLLKIFHDLVSALSDASSLHFNTLFARVSYITTRYQRSRPWSYAMQIIRREQKQRQMPSAELAPLLKACIEYLLEIYRTETCDDRKVVRIPKLPHLPPAKNAGRFKKKFARVVATEWNREKKILTIVDESVPDVTCFLHYSVEGINDIYSDTLELAVQEVGLPLVLGLTDIDSTEENHFIPAYIVIMPDLLMDVTSIAQMYSSGQDPHAINIMDLFLPSDATDAILLGQVANFFLDELIRDTDIPFHDLFTRSFKVYPIEFVQLSDERLKEMYSTMKGHYHNIVMAINDRFPAVGIDKKECIIEPSYFSPQYGIKGRLDLYYHHEEEKTASIVELKSGRPFKPNSYGLSSSNYHQTLLYELLIKSVHGPQHHRANFILYSSSAEDPLRFAVSVESLQKETIQNRNELVLLHLRMLGLDRPDTRDVLEEINPNRFPDLKGYLRTNIQNWYKVYSALAPGEKNYFRHFTAFISREHMLARIGSDGSEMACGLAGLWLDKTEVKEERYQILRGLELNKIDPSHHQTLLYFKRSDLTNPLANFRAGDIAIMYPYEDDNAADPTKHQLYRANVISVDPGEVVIKLRNHQVHIGQMLAVTRWNLEHDLLDSSFRGLYQALWMYISADALKRQIIFGLVKPINNTLPLTAPPPADLTPHQLSIYHEGLQAESIYLLWGPPGTGKTSKMLKSWVWHYFYYSKSRIALLAYTNKAVDEICEAICQLGDEVKEHYIRIGSRAGSGEKFRGRLLDTLIAPMSRRSEIKDLLAQTRIYVGTVASLQGKSELFKLINIDVAIVDEASQILEPSMVGLMSRFGKTILIGDHMQLPAVSVQSPSLSVVQRNEWSERIGLYDLGMSYFERIYRLYSSKGWDHVIGLLFEQGRMHAEIQAFANEMVYHDQLSCLHPLEQSRSLHDLTGEEGNILFEKRLLYLPSQYDLKEICLKTNQNEAHAVIQCILHWQKKISESGLEWTIGVITPFRAQIAAILHLASVHELDMNNVTVDTVERYQGGARDIIIMSCAVNSKGFLSRIVSNNAEGIDRKLNVAVTRARQQFILIGNEEILMNEIGYASLIRHSHRLDETHFPLLHQLHQNTVV